MEKRTSIILNIVLGFLFLVGIGAFLLSSSKTPIKHISSMPDSVYVIDVNRDGILDTVHTVGTVDSKEEKHVNWEGILTALGSIISFGVKTYYEHRKKGQATPLKYDNNKHPTFSIIHELQANEIRNLNLGAPGRTQVFRLMLQIQLSSYEEALREFITTTFSESTDFRVKARMLILNIVEDYEQKWRNQNVPDLVIERYKTLQQDRIRLLLADIDTLAFYRLTDDTTDFSEVLFYLLTHVSVILRLSVANDTLQTLRELNGTLKTVTYNGQPL
jgi:hypothetical protein